MKGKLLLVSIFIAFAATGFAQKVIPLSDKDKQAFVQAHNAFRAKVGSPPVEWSDELANYAKGWALMMAKTKRFQHSPGQKYGENIYKSTFKPLPGDVVSSWAEEQKYYHGEKLSLDNYWIFGHYTQIIWKQTTQIGCAISQDADGTYYVVCEYYPPGNIIGKKPTD